ncbi:MAG: hypothetical protein ACFCVF_14910 [Kineosporiaceae bacterium]
MDFSIHSENFAEKRTLTEALGRWRHTPSAILPYPSTVSAAAATTAAVAAAPFDPTGLEGERGSP